MSINEAVDSAREKSLKPDVLEKVFNNWWPHLDSQLKDVPSTGKVPRTERNDREILEEILELVRALKRGTEVPFFSGLAGFPSGRLSDYLSVSSISPVEVHEGAGAEENRRRRLEQLLRKKEEEK